MYKTRSKSYNYFYPIETERDKKQNIIESNKAYLKNMIKSLNIGQVIKGKVIEIKDRWAIVEFQSIRCFLHISEISNAWVDHPSEFLTINEFVSAKIISKGINKQGKYNITISTKDFKKAITNHKENNPANSKENPVSNKSSTERPFNPPKIR